MTKAYYLYDKETYKYIDTVYTALGQPDNSTEIAPVASLNGIDYWLDNAVFNPQTQSWSGDNASYQTQKQVSMLTQLVMQQGQQIAELTAKLQAK